MKEQRVILTDWRPDRSSHLPVYQQIIQYISENIRTGIWGLGYLLPTQRDMAASFQVNRSTIRTVMEELASYGIVESNQKAGTRIVGNTWSLMLSSKNYWTDTVTEGSFHSNQLMIQTINRMEFEEGILRLGTGEPDPSLFPKEMWGKAITKLQRLDSLGYLEPLGMLALRCAIADYAVQKGIHCTPQQILITSGSLQALQLISVSLLGKDSVVYTEEPSYLNSLNVIQSAGISLTSISMDPEGILFHKIPAVEKRSRILYTIPANQNPTGITMSKARRKQLYEYCALHQIPIIEDGAYEELYYESQPLPIKAMDHSDLVLSLGTASKTLSPGLRIGWVIAQEAVVARLGDVKMQMDYGASSVSQLIFLEFLQSGMYQEHCSFLRKEMCERRDHAVITMRNVLGDLVEFDIPGGGFYLWVRVKAAIPMDKLFEEALKAGVLLNPGDIYTKDSTRRLRISYAYLKKEEFTKAVKMLGKCIDSLLRK